MVGFDGDLPLCAEKKNSQTNKSKKRVAIETPSQKIKNMVFTKCSEWDWKYLLYLHTWL